MTPTRNIRLEASQVVCERSMPSDLRLYASKMEKDPAKRVPFRRVPAAARSQQPVEGSYYANRNVESRFTERR